VLVSLAAVAGQGDAASLELGPYAALRGCFSIGLLLATPLVGIAAWAFRRAFPASAVWRGAAFGAASGLAAASVLTLHCGMTAGGHVLLAHGLPVVLAVVGAGLLAGRTGRA
jgi:hypothetical protein